MTLLIVSFLAGALTVLAPCILPLLPVVIGSSVSGRSRWTPYRVVGALAVSIILFTYILKVSTVFIDIPPQAWSYLSGGILIGFGVTLLWPRLWTMFPGVRQLSVGSNKVLGKGYIEKTAWGDVLVGASLGPVFSTCSPTYFVILATVLPASFALGTVYLIAYTLGLTIVLLMIALLGERFAGKLAHVADDRQIWKKVLGAVFVLLGLAIMFGWEKKFETQLLDRGYFDITSVEHRLLEDVETP